MANLKKRYKGLHAHRYPSNPREHRFAETWQRFNEKCSCMTTGASETVLASILHTGDTVSPRIPSDRDFEVAATVIQWLGSPVGQDFLREAVPELDYDPETGEVRDET
jgi:multisubunit Na+/H+ antiporter MnhG subunit